jgi:hypothetical protein
VPVARSLEFACSPVHESDHLLLVGEDEHFDMERQFGWRRLVDHPATRGAHEIETGGYAGVRLTSAVA